MNSRTLIPIEYVLFNECYKLKLSKAKTLVLRNWAKGSTISMMTLDHAQILTLVGQCSCCVVQN
jgi:hypothetical protein